MPGALGGDGAAVNASIDDLRQAAATLEQRGRSARVVSETGSTNDDARAWASQGARDGSVIIADTQTQGRGRHGRSWSTPSGSTLAMSVIVRPPLRPSALPPLSLVAGLAVREAVGARVANAMIKWPNDVVVDGKKIAGILVEAALSGDRVEHVVVGIGVNVARTTFPPELADRATSLQLAGAQQASLHRGMLALDVVDALGRELDAHLHQPERLADRLRPFDVLAGRRVRVVATGALGRADGIEPDGRLAVVLDQGARAWVLAGEMELVT